MRIIRKELNKATNYTDIKFYRIITIIFLTILSSSEILAQEHDDEHNDHDFKHHRLSVIIDHGHVFGAEELGSGNKIAIIPAWDFDYQYWINEKFSLSLKIDIEIMDYVVNSGSESEIVRNSQLFISTVYIYNPYKGWNFFTGPEIEKKHNFFVLRAGCGYEFEVANHWEFAPEIIFEEWKNRGFNLWNRCG